MKQDLITSLSAELSKLYPNLKAYKCERYASKYIEDVLPAIAYSIQFKSNDLNDDELAIDKSALSSEVRHEGKRMYLFDFMHRSEKTCILNVTRTGFTGMLTKAVINPIYKDMVMSALDDTSDMLTPYAKEDIRNNWNVKIPVESSTLTSYIQRTKQDMDAEKEGSAIHRVLERNYFSARAILSQIVDENGREYIYEVWKESDSGRRYGKYNSLQSRHKSVRHAALGHCYKYDFKACAFSAMLGLAHMLDDTIRVEAIRSYIKYRSEIREKISRETGIPLSAIKEIFTALGFGASAINNPFNAIGKHFKNNPEGFDALCNNRTFRYITEDLDAVNQVILNNATLSQDEFEFMGRNYTAHPADSKRKRTDNQKLAWIYQGLESHMLATFIQHIENLSGQTPLLDVHDCVYYKQPIPKDAFISALAFTRDVFPYADLEMDEINPIVTNATFEERKRILEDEAQEHLNFIKREEAIIKEYF